MAESGGDVDAGSPAAAVLPPLSIGSRSSRNARSTSSPRLAPLAHPFDSSAIDQGMPRRLSGTTQDEGALLNALEAEEERLVLLLTKKLELLRADKAKSENAAEYDSESMVLKLQRQLAALQLQQQQQQQSQQQAQDVALDSTGVSPIASLPSSPFANNTALPMLAQPQLDIEPGIVVNALKSENDHLRSRVASAEIAFTRERRLNDVLRSELLDLRNRLGIDTSDLVGLSPFGTSPRAGSRSASPSGRTNGTPIPTTNRSSRPMQMNSSSSMSRDRSDSISNSILSTLSSPDSFSPPTSFTSTQWSAPNSLSQTSYNTTPSSSYSTPQVPVSTPVRPSAFRNRAQSSGSDITEEGREGDRGMAVRDIPVPGAPPPSMSTSLADRAPSFPNRSSARVAETGTLQRRRSSNQASGV